MKLTGYRIRERLNALLIDHKIAADAFSGSLVYFEDDGQGETPDSVASRFAEAERKVASLQAVQARYNLAVPVEVQGERMTLCEAIKRVGGAGRLEKMWRDASSTLRATDWRGAPVKRTKDEVVAKRALSPEECGKRAVKAARYAAALRAAVAQGNTTEIDIDCDLALFEDQA